MFRLHLDLRDLLNTRYLHGTQSILGEDFIDGQGQVDNRNNELHFRMQYRLKSIKTSPDLTAIGVEISDFSILKSERQSQNLRSSNHILVTQ